MSDPIHLGAALPRPMASLELQARLESRRSSPAQGLAAPGPDEAELGQILRLGARTPDHGKLFPWRFVVLGPVTRASLADQLTPLAAHQPHPDKARAVLAKLVNPPVSILVVSTPTPGHKVPVWEQQLSAGAVCMNLLHAADALGYSANWITDWYSYAPEGRALLGLGDGETVAGFIHIGTAHEPPLERVRPSLADRVERRP